MPSQAEQELRNRVDSYVGSRLPTDVAAWVKKYRTKAKIIHDGLWGTFELYPYHLAILDTPLLQRLRFIKQTGCTYLTYPSSLHSRFEHTIGVLYQTIKIASVITARTPKKLGETELANLSVAAIMHDTGHGPFSHSSEEFYSSLGHMASYIQEQEAAGFKSGAGEVLSSFIVESKPFRAFISQINEICAMRLDCDQISKIITGRLGDENMYLSEIVHGPFDADKLDYLHRDGMFSGLQMNVDLDRLLNSIGVETYPVPHVAGRRQTRIVGTVAGTTPLEQIMFNKMLLHVGIYHHPKVRACDCMLQAIFEISVEKSVNVGGVKLEQATDFLQLTDDFLLMSALTEDATIKKIIQDIRDRRIWKRAIVIARRTVPEDAHSNKMAFQLLVKMAGSDRAYRDQRKELATKIWEEAGKPCEQHEVWLDLPKPPNLNEAKRTWISVGNAAAPIELQDIVPVEDWVNQYVTHKWRGHVFCPEDARQKINQAAQNVLLTKFDLAFNALATSLAKIDQ